MHKRRDIRNFLIIIQFQHSRDRCVAVQARQADRWQVRRHESSITVHYHMLPCTRQPTVMLQL